MNEARDRQILLAIAEVATPSGDVIPAPTEATISEALSLLEATAAQWVGGYRLLLRTVDCASVPKFGSRLHRLAPPSRARALEALSHSDLHWAVRAVVSPLKLVQARQPGLAEALAVKSPTALASYREPPRYQRRIVDGESLEGDDVEVDAVVVGTGAGGAPVARALAANGFAVLMLEEGQHHTRKDFDGEPLGMQAKLYRDKGMTVALGNTVIPIPLGRAVGGTTLINSGTCFRVGGQVQRRWQLELGLSELRPGQLDRYYERVEHMLQVGPSPDEVLGGIARVVARGCDALGYSHHVLDRNAPGCDGQGVCCFGCPTDAKRSTNLSYVPAALECGAMVATGARVTRILREGRRAVGVVAQTKRADGSEGTITVRAKVVVLACGSNQTPALLLHNGLANSSDQVGRNLSIHPACHSWGAFDESIRGWEAVPQGYGIDEFVDQGIRFEGGALPPRYAASFLGHVGERWTAMVERFEQLAPFGFMIADEGRGRVTLGANGRPRMTYWVHDVDRRKMIQGHAILARVFLAAGATDVFPGMQQFDHLRNEQDVSRLERDGPDLLKVRDIDISAYHPLGTCRMGVDPRRAVVKPTHETYDVDNLYVCDGSTVPGPLGVNPQMTIMAFAERAAESISARIDDHVARPQVAMTRPERVQVAFTETMAGSCELQLGERAGATVALAFHVTAVANSDLFAEALTRRGGSWDLNGTVDWEGFADAAPCVGTLLMRPLRGEAGLVYDLRFTADDGRRYTLQGRKNLSLWRPLRGATTLHTEVRDVDRHETAARGVLRFNLRELLPWMVSWRLGSSAGVVRDRRALVGS